MLSFYSGSYSYLAVYPDTAPDLTVEIKLKSEDGAEIRQGRRRRLVVFPLAENTAYNLSAENGKISLAYLYSEDDREEGISFLTENGEAPLPLCSLSAAAYSDGLYHLYYLSSPFGKTDENRYLCHLVSRDLVSWRHLPILLEPPKELCLVRHRTGGIFGGCTETENGIVRLHFIRRISEGKTGKTITEYQSAMESRDLMHFSPEETVLREAPPKATEISCPFIFTDKGETYLILGGASGGKGTLFLYRKEGAGWTYVSPILKDATSRGIDFPSCFRLGRTMVFLCVLLDAVGDGTPSPACLFTGGFRDGRYRIQSRECLDFGGDFYAPRAVFDGERQLLFGLTSEKGGNLIVREIRRKRGAFYITPPKEVYGTLGEPFFLGEDASVLKDRADYYVELSFSGKTAFSLLLGRNEEETLYFSGDGETCGFEIQGEEGRKKRFSVEVPPEKIEIFVHAEFAEVFINDGRAAGAKYFPKAENVFKAEFACADCVESFTLRPMMPETFF